MRRGSATSTRSPRPAPGVSSAHALDGSPSTRFEAGYEKSPSVSELEANADGMRYRFDVTALRLEWWCEEVSSRCRTATPRMSSRQSTNVARSRETSTGRPRARSSYSAIGCGRREDRPRSAPSQGRGRKCPVRWRAGSTRGCPSPRSRATGPSAVLRCRCCRSSTSRCGGCSRTNLPRWPPSRYAFGGRVTSPSVYSARSLRGPRCRPTAPD